MPLRKLARAKFEALHQSVNVKTSFLRSSFTLSAKLLVPKWLSNVFKP